MIFIYFILGLIVGSFLNAVIHRLHSKESIVFARSHCPHCHTELGPLDLVPLFSFIFLKGRCRYCGKKISWQYPLIEFVTALTFLLLAWHHHYYLGMLLFINLAFASVFIVIAVYDFKHFLILDKVVFPFLAVAFAVDLFRDIGNSCVTSLNCATLGGIVSALIISVFFWVQYTYSKGRWIGFGDVKLGLLLGMVLGWPLALVSLFISYIFGAVVGVALIAMGKKKLSSKLAFGTFLSISAIITLIAGSAILDWYLTLIGLTV